MPIQQDDDFWVTRLDRLEAKQDRILDTQTDMLLKITHNSAILAEHQRRSLANEDLVVLAKAEADRKFTELRLEMKPLTAVHTATTLAAKVVVFLSVVTGFVYTIARFLGLAH